MTTASRRHGCDRTMLVLALTLSPPPSAQKDGLPARMPGESPALAPDGVPATSASPRHLHHGRRRSRSPLRHQRLRRHVHPPRAWRLRRTPRAHGPHLTHTFSDRHHGGHRRPSITSSTPPTIPSPPLPPTPPASVGSKPWPTARGSQRRPASPSACPPKPSGNTSPAPAAKTLRQLRHHAHARPAQCLRRREHGSRPPRVDARLVRPLPARRAQTDPVGAAPATPASSAAAASTAANRDKTVPDLNVPATAPYFARAANRASMAPAYASAKATSASASCRRPCPRPHPPHPPHTSSSRPPSSSNHRPNALTTGPDPAKPWYHTHELFPNLDGQSMPDVGWRLGLAPGLGINYHNSAIQELPNGDLLAAYYNTPRQRRRSRPDRPHHAPPRRRRRLGHARALPRSSPTPASPLPSSGTTNPPRQALDVLRIRTPHRRSALRLHDFERQRRHLVAKSCSRTSPRPSAATSRSPSTPSSAPRTAPSTSPPTPPARTTTATAPSPQSGPPGRRQTWYDTGGRTAGRHTTIVIANNGDLLGFGGKNSDIDGRMPMAPSTDGGKTWKKSKTPFDPLASGERPSVIRLASGRLFFVADYNPKTRNTSTKTAPMSRSPTTTARPGPSSAYPPTSSPLATPPQPRAPTASSTSSPPRTPPTTKSNSTKPGSSKIRETQTCGAPSGRRFIVGTGDRRMPTPHRALPLRQVKSSWSTGTLPDGRIVLEGPEQFFYPSAAPCGPSTSSRPEDRRRTLSARRRHAHLARTTTPTAPGPGRTTTPPANTPQSHWRNKTLLNSDVPTPPPKTPRRRQLPEPDGL